MPDRDKLIQRYADGPDLIRLALTRVPPEAIKWKPAPGKWSAHQIVCHCADAETVGAVRLRFLLCEDSPRIAPYDQDRWADTLDYDKQTLGGALATLVAVRAQTEELLRGLPGSAWSREGTHPDYGRYTVDDWLRVYAEHLEKHARQIDRNADAWKVR